MHGERQKIEKGEITRTEGETRKKMSEHINHERGDGEGEIKTATSFDIGY